VLLSASAAIDKLVPEGTGLLAVGGMHNESHEKLIGAIVRSIPLGRIEYRSGHLLLRVTRRRLHHGPDPERQRRLDNALRVAGGG
jgi:hypothetical protein